MKIKTCFFLLLFPYIVPAQKIHIESENYTDKAFDLFTAQTINLDSFHSPNSRSNQNKELLVILAASGGGSRSASITIGVLLELERILIAQKAKDHSNALDEIDYFSTVSGGGWGASSYIAFLHQKDKYGITSYNPHRTFNEFEVYLANWADRKYARHQLGYFFSDLFLRSGVRGSGDVNTDRLNTGYLGWGYRRYIEECLFEENNYNGKFDQDNVKPILLGDVFKLKSSPEKPKFPMVVPNTTNLDNFFLVPFSPDRLQYWGVSRYRLTKISGAQYYPEKLLESLELAELLQIPLASGIKASSSVPGFIGASYFESRKQNRKYFLRLQDGGILDNQGLHTTKAILKQESTIKDPKKRIVFIVDASGAGLTTSRPKKRHERRRKSLLKIATQATPGAQYPLMREEIQNLEKEYDCTVIYLGTEVLLNPALGLGGAIPSSLKVKRSKAEKKFYGQYNLTLDNGMYYPENVSMEDRSLLYQYVSSEIPTWFSAKRTSTKGKILVDPRKTEGTGKVLFLAGRAIVQLKKEDIINAFYAAGGSSE